MNRAFDPITQRILEGFSLSHPTNVVGSMRYRGMYWPTDIDQFQKIRVESISEAVDFLRAAIRTLRSIPNVRCTEIKWSGNKMTPSIFLKKPMKTLKNMLKSGGMIKLDAIAWIDSGARFTEFSCVYQFTMNGIILNPHQSSLIESLQADVENYGNQMYWFKALKRHASIARALGKSTTKYDIFFRSDYGLLYSVLSDLTTLDLLGTIPKHKLRIELDALYNRMGAVQLEDPRLHSILQDLLKGNWKEAEPIIQNIVNTGAREWMKEHIT